MIVVTKDGRTLELNSNDKVKFTAAAYAGRYNCFFVEAMIRPRFSQKSVRVRVNLGEYDNRDTAEAAETALSATFKAGADKYCMPENAGIALHDNLTAAIKTAHEIMLPVCELGYELEFGAINGKTNSSYGLNPDEHGSYFEALMKLWEKHASESLLGVRSPSPARATA